MIFLSAQPDDFYFTWQIELQLINFCKLGIPKKDIHVLIGYNPKVGIKSFFQDLIERNQHKAEFFIYPDTRRQKNYAPSIRPHIIQKHLLNNKYIENEVIFYHDADIIFREIPYFEGMLDDDVWYLSDTRDYLDSTYIKQNAGEKTFKAMCSTIGIDPEIVSNNDQHCGGAQYLLKRTTIEFWSKVERDCEALYMLLNDHNNRQAELFFDKYGTKKWEYIGIQSWCADMWVVFWNALLLKKKLRIHSELDFVMAKSPIEKWETTKILHYSGEETNAPGPVFRKINYTQFDPYYDHNLDIKDYSKTASFALVKLIKDHRTQLDKHRIDLQDVTFLIPVRIDSESRLDNLYAAVHYINKYFNTKISIAESDIAPKVDTSRLPKCCRYIFLRDDNKLMHRTRINNILIKNAKSDIIAIYDTDVILPIKQIVESVDEIRKKKADLVSPYSGDFVGVPNLFKNMFIKILDPLLFTLNLGKFHIVSRRSYGGAVFLSRNTYISAGMENENFTSWGPEDIERPKRMKNLGYKISRVNGPLFHLPHERNSNSGYPDQTYYRKFIEEYLKICDMDKKNLETYIADWSWIKPAKKI